VSWHKQNKEFEADGTPPDYNFSGSLIFASNKDFQQIVDEKGPGAVHIEAMMSRALVLDLRVHSRRALSLWINYICGEGKLFQKENVDLKLGALLLKWLHDHQTELREYSLRTVHKLCNATKIQGQEWKDIAEMTLLR